MYNETEFLWDSLSGIIAGVLSLILIITFFVMAYRLRKIMMGVSSSGLDAIKNYLRLARACEEANKKQDALEYYFLALFEFKESKIVHLLISSQFLTAAHIEKKIQKLGGDPEASFDNFGDLNGVDN